jgi:hypothetical protein
MHIHPNHVSPNSQLDATHAAEKGSAKAAAERTRRKLMESASELAGAAEEAFVVNVESQEGGSDSDGSRAARQFKQRSGDSAEVEEDHTVSDWA